MQDNANAGSNHTAGAAEGVPANAKMVLATLITVAAVANLPLAMANIALPSIGTAFNASQTQLNLVAVGYSLGLACSVLWLGALGDHYGRKLMCLLGVIIAIPAALLAGLAPTIEVMIAARLLGGFAAGMAYPTTLSLIAALWAPGPERTRSIALWAAIGGAISVSGPLLSGLLRRASCRRVRRRGHRGPCCLSGCRAGHFPNTERNHHVFCGGAISSDPVSAVRRRDPVRCPNVLSGRRPAGIHRRDSGCRAGSSARLLSVPQA